MNVELLNHKDCRLVLLVSEKDIHDPSICPIMHQVLFDHTTCFSLNIKERNYLSMENVENIMLKL